MTSIEERVSALEAEVQEIRYTHASRIDAFAAGQSQLHQELLSFRQETRDRFDGIDGRFDGIDARLDGIDGRFDGIDARLDGIDGRFDRIEGLLGTIMDRLPEPPAN